MPATIPIGLAVTRVHPEFPIFRLDDGARTAFYTPGRAVSTSPARADLVERILANEPVTAETEAQALAGAVLAQGQQARRAWLDFVNTPFEPECLTVYLSNKCNLACSYCYAAPADPAQARLRVLPAAPSDADEFPTVPPHIVVAAARVVARHSVAKGKPLGLILHGGGEPTVHWDLLQQLRRQVGEVAAAHGLDLWSYIATNGVLPQERAAWLASQFHLIGLSCDGPPDAQNRSRPAASGAPTAGAVERTARIFVDAGVEFHVRVTITPASVRRQAEIVTYCRHRLGARTVRFEASYDGRRASPSHFSANEAEEFVEYFLQAREAARHAECSLHVSGIRLDEIHGPFCNPLRQVLQLSPTGGASACFLTADSRDPGDAVMALGHFDAATGEFLVDHGRAARLREKAARVPARCESCINIYHCARDCPDVCLVTVDGVNDRAAGFRCRVQTLLGQAFLREQLEATPSS